MFTRYIAPKLCWLSLMLLAVPAVLSAADHSASEYSVKAAIVYKITKFVHWPDAAFVLADDPLNICLAQGSPFAKPMQSLQGRQVHGRTIEVVSYKDFSTVQAQCQVLIVSNDDVQQVDQLLLSASSRPLLTVGESDGFAERGGIVALQVEQSRVGFAINVEAGQRAGLEISAQLLQLARIVSSDGV